MTEDIDEEGDLYLRVSVGEVTVEVEGPLDEAETWFESLQEDYLSDIDTANYATNGGEPTSVNNGNPQPSNSNLSQPGSGKSRSLTEYYKMADSPTKQDSALIVGWYLEYHEEEDNFTKGEIEERATDAKITLGANVSRDLGNQVKESHIAKIDERDGKDAYHLTLSGEEYIEEELLGID